MPALDARCWPSGLGRTLGRRHASGTNGGGGIGSSYRSDHTGNGGAGGAIRHSLPFSTSKSDGEAEREDGVDSDFVFDEEGDEELDERALKRAEREARRAKREARKEAKALAANEIDAYDTDFLRDNFERQSTGRGSTFEGSMAPFRPDNWEELLAEAQAAYPERAGPRRNKRAEREKNRRWVIMRQHRVRKGQQREARSKKYVAIQKNIAKMADMYNTHGFAPAMEYAAAVGDRAALDSVGLGGRLGEKHFLGNFKEVDVRWEEAGEGGEDGETQAGSEGGTAVGAKL